MQFHDPRPSAHRQTGLTDGLVRATHALIGAASLALCGCVAHDYIRTLTYDYTDPHQLAAERRADRLMQDSCYFSGYQYFKTAGPPQIVSEDGTAGRHVQATQSFYCVGTVGGP
jgi:hypothetical protein